jgi:hypothetical protein
MPKTEKPPKGSEEKPKGSDGPGGNAEAGFARMEWRRRPMPCRRRPFWHWPRLTKYPWLDKSHLGTSGGRRDDARRWDGQHLSINLLIRNKKTGWKDEEEDNEEEKMLERSLGKFFKALLLAAMALYYCVEESPTAGMDDDFKNANWNSVSEQQQQKQPASQPEYLKYEVAG